MESTSNIPRLEVIIFSGFTGGDELQKSGGRYIFVGCGRSRTTVLSMEVRCSGGEVGSGRGDCCCRIGLISVRGVIRPCKIVSPPKPRGRHTLSVVVVKAKKQIWAQNCERGKVKRDDKG